MTPRHQLLVLLVVWLSAAGILAGVMVATMVYGLLASK